MNTKILIPPVIILVSILNFVSYAEHSDEELINGNLNNYIEARHQNYEYINIGFKTLKPRVDRLNTTSSLELGASPMYSQQVNLITVDKLNERLKQGRDTIYVVNFWATWCAPCIKELPHFEKLQQEKRKEKLKVLLVSVDFKNRLEKSVIPFVKKHGLTTEVFLLNETDQQMFIDKIDNTWSGAIPATLFVKGNNRKFLEKEFTYPSLLIEYQTFK